MHHVVVTGEEMEPRVPLQVPPLSLLCTNTLQRGWGAHLQDLAAAEMWSVVDERK